MTPAPLRKIEADLGALIERVDDEHPIDLLELKIIARRIGAQAEMVERGIDE